MTHPHHGETGLPHHEHDEASVDEAFLDLLDLDAQVLHAYWSAALGWVQEAAADRVPTRILDLGAGTGTGALGLAQRFPDAVVVALDVSSESLGHLQAKASRLGLASRVRTLEADLDAGWPDLSRLDLTWASMSLHHMANPTQVLRDVRAATSPGGLVAVAEFAEPLRFLPDDLGSGRRGFEQRTVDLLAAAHAEALPTLGSDWAPRLTEAGWRVLDERAFTIDLDPATEAGGADYARAWFGRLAHRLEESLDPDDRLTLAALLDDDGAHSILRRTDLHIRGVRTVTLARAA